MSEEHEKYKEAAHARIGADRMALGLACIPDGIAGDLAVVSDLRKKRDALLEACEALLASAGWPAGKVKGDRYHEACEKSRAAIAMAREGEK